MADKLALLRKYVVTLVKAETDPRRLMDVACVLQAALARPTRSTSRASVRNASWPSFKVSPR
jgi:hypothetical protein